MCPASLRLTATTLLHSNRPSTSIQLKAAMKKRWRRAATRVQATWGRGRRLTYEPTPPTEDSPPREGRNIRTITAIPTADKHGSQ